MAILCRKDEADYFSPNFLCILRTTTTHHMVSFIDFYFHFLANDTNSEPELPVVTVSFSQETEGSQDQLRALSVALQATCRAPAGI